MFVLKSKYLRLLKEKEGWSEEAKQWIDLAKRQQRSHFVQIEKLKTELAALIEQIKPTQRSEIRLTERGELDEVVGAGEFHLEKMDNGHWFALLGDVAVWLHSFDRISTTHERRPS